MTRLFLAAAALYLAWRARPRFLTDCPNCPHPEAGDE